MVEKITVICLVVGAFVEIAPIKLSPLAWLGNRLHRDLNSKIDELESHIDRIEIDTVRNRIVEFDRLLRKGSHIKLYEYKAIFKDIDAWQRFHNKYPSLNGMIDVAIENIKEAYKNDTFE